MPSNQKHTLDTWINWRTLTKEAVAAKLAAKPEQIETGLKYEKLDSLTKIYCPDKYPAHFYFKGDRQVMQYIGDETALRPFHASTLMKRFGEPIELDSRAGKYPHYVHPEQGIAYSADGEQIILLEIFPPCSLEDYLANIYEQPAPFRK